MKDNPLPTRSRPGRPAMLPVAAAALALLTGCIQAVSLPRDRAIVEGAIAVPDGEGEAGIRIDLSNSAPSRQNQSRDLLLTAAAFTDEDGAFSVPTPEDGPGFFAVARHPYFDMEVGPLAALSVGRTTTLTSFLALADLETGAQAPVNAPPTMTRKLPGRVKFMFLRRESAFTKLPNVEVFGDFNGFSKKNGLIEVFDDGSQVEQSDEDGNPFYSGDTVVNDGVYVRVIDGLPPGNLRYNFLLSRNLVIRDLFEEGSEVMVDEENLPVIRSVVKVF